MTQPDILLVDDDAGAIQLMGRILAGVGKMRFATNGEDALRCARERVPDLVLLDAEMPGMSGFEVFEAMRAEPLLAPVPVIFVTCHSDVEFEVAGFQLGAADFIAKPVSPPLLLARVQTQLRMKAMSDELRAIATIDMLTRVANRRRFDEALEQEWHRTRRSGDPMALLMIDVDHFRSYNERYGYREGDVCLRSVANSLVSTNICPLGLVARASGKKFALLLPQTAAAGAERAAHAMLDLVESLHIPHEGSSTSTHVTISIGIACYDKASECWIQPDADARLTADLRPRCSPVDLVRAAERALLAAKRAGRAQARLLDISHVDMPSFSRQIVPALRAASCVAST
jgi:diguanylate cyclase (GGDEF)-like protein